MTFIIDIPIYRCSVVVLANATKEEWIAFCDEHKNEITDRDKLNVLDGFDEGIPGFVCNTEGNDYVCYISDKNKIGLSVHELFHAAQSILWDKGYKMDKTAEPLAYLLEYITNEFYLVVNNEEEK